MHIKCLQSYKAQSPSQRELFSPTENTASELPKTALLPQPIPLTYLCHYVNRLHLHLSFLILPTTQSTLQLELAFTHQSYLYTGGMQEQFEAIWVQVPKDIYRVPWIKWCSTS